MSDFQAKTKKVTVGSVSTRKDGTGCYLKISQDKFNDLKAAVVNASKQSKDLYLNVEFFEPNLKAALTSGKLSTQRSEAQEKRVESIVEKAPGILSDVTVSLPA